MTDDIKLRDKYRDLALEAEQHEQQLRQSLEQMRSLATQLKLVAYGYTPQLDALLNELLSQLKPELLDRLPGLLRKTEKQLRLLDEDRARHAERLTGCIRDWLEQQEQHRGGGSDAALDDLRQRLVETGDNVHRLPELIEVFMDLQQQGQPVAGAVTNDDLSRHEGLASARLATRLLELIQQLNISAEHRPRALALIHRLEAGPGVEELEVCLRDVTDLARSCGGSTETDIQEYLLGLNEQLAWLHQFLDRAEDSEIRQRKRNNLLDQSVRQDVRLISHTVKNTSDINELKKAVNTQLASLIKAVNHHKQAENEHLEALKQERQSLQTRLDEMERRSELFRKSAEEAHAQSRIDPLTGLGNRLAYDQQFANELERFQRYATPFSVCIADIDLFKTVNDEYGHLAGDKVLRLMAKILRTNLRSVDFIGRFGGEEFVVLMPSTNREAAVQAAEKVRQAVEESPFNFQGTPVTITLSAGVAEVMPGDTADTLFARADSSLYEAKHNGRNCVRSNSAPGG